MIDRASCMPCFVMWLCVCACMCVAECAKTRIRCFEFCILCCPFISLDSLYFYFVVGFFLNVSRVCMPFFCFPLVLLASRLCRPVCQKCKTVSLEKRQFYQINTTRETQYSNCGQHRNFNFVWNFPVPYLCLGSLFLHDFWYLLLAFWSQIQNDVWMCVI